MLTLNPIKILPPDIQRDWRAQLHPAQPTAAGVFRLVGIRRTQPGTFEEQRVIVLVVDEDGRPLPNVPVAFAFSTAKYYELSDAFQWLPPEPQKAFIVPTQGAGQIDMIQGSGVKDGEAGGITVYLLEPKYASDVVSGCGMLANHSGLHLTFALQRTDVVPVAERLAAIEARVDKLEGRID